MANEINPKLEQLEKSLEGLLFTDDMLPVDVVYNRITKLLQKAYLIGYIEASVKILEVLEKRY